jgi:type IX secretion system PorP/SprF family membrane protein
MSTPKLFRLGLLLPCLVFASLLTAQETNFTQFFNLPIALNPAYISVPTSVEITAGYRKQWPNLQGGLQGSFAGVAIHQCGTPIGFGLTVAQLGEDVFGYRIREATFQLGSYVNTSKYSSLHLGMQATVGTRGIDATNQVFSGQLDPVFGIVRDNSTFVSVEQATARTFALGGGVAWRGELALGSLEGPVSAGFAVHNLGGSRDISFENIETTLRPRFIAHFSVALPIADKYQDVAAIYVTPIMRIDMQGKLRETYAGCIFQFQKTYIGVIYQNARNPVNVKNTNTLSIGPGIELDMTDDTRVSIGYSFDMPLSGLGPRATNGSHELSLRFKFDNTCLFGSPRGKGGRKGGFFGGRRGKTKCYAFDRKNFLGFMN